MRMETVTCPECHAVLNAPEQALGGTVRCPRCNAVFAASAGENNPPARPASPPLPPSRPATDDYDERPSRRREDAPDAWDEVATVRPLPEDYHAWRSVQTGAGVYLTGHVLYLSGVGLLLLLLLRSLSAGPGSGWNDRTPVLILGLLGVLAGLLIASNWVLAVIATGFWAPAPVRYGARGLAIACLVIGGLALLEMPSLFLRLLTGVHPVLRGPEDRFLDDPFLMRPAEFLFVLFVLEASRLALFPFFLRAVGKGLHSQTLASQGMALGIGTLVLLGGTLGLDVLALLFRTTAAMPGIWNERSGLGALLMVINMGTPLAVLVWGVIVLQSARRVLRTKLRPR
jgi:predicted Zn finger-like uncharacterized protein